MTEPCAPRQHRDSGAALLLAIGFVILVGTICGGLVGLATSSLKNRSSLELLRDREYAADAAIEQAILQATGFTCSTDPADPTKAIPLQTLNGVTIRVSWRNACGTIPASDAAVGGLPLVQRNVVFSACLSTVNPCANDTDVIIRAQVNFQPDSGTVTKTYIQSWSVN
jgi:hypothetical protein